MGLYIDPPNQTKEEWLSDNAVPISWDELRSFTKPRNWPPTDNRLPVVLLDNTAFTAIGVAYCQAELVVFTDPADPRRRAGYLVPIEKIIKVVGKQSAKMFRLTA